MQMIVCLFDMFHTETLRESLFTGVVSHCESYLNYSVLYGLFASQRSSALYRKHPPTPPQLQTGNAEST